MQASSAPAPRRPRWRKTKIALGILVVLLLAAVAFLFRPMASPAAPRRKTTVRSTWWSSAAG